MGNWQNIPVTLVLILAQVAIYIGLAIISDSWHEPSAQVLLDWGANFDGYTLNAQWWRLLTNTFLHAGIFHLLVNLVSLYYIGLLLEPRVKQLKFLIAYSICALCGSMASLWWHTFVISVGASGAVFGLFGIYLILFAANTANLKLRLGFIAMSILIIGFNLALGEWLGFVDNAAHLGGLTAGLFIGAFYQTDGLVVPKTNLQYHLSTLVVTILSVGILLLGLIFIPNYPAEYFQMFQQYTINEKNAIALSNSPYDTDEIYLRQLKQRAELWKQNKELAGVFPSTPNTMINKDLDVLYTYAYLKNKEVQLLIKSMQEEAYTYIDTLHILSERSENLPQLNFPLLMEADSFISKATNNPLPLETIKILYDENWFRTTVAAKAKYYRIAQVDSLGRVQQWAFDYYLNGDLQMKGYYEHNVQDGLFFYFFPGRKYEAIGMYSYEAKVGKWQNYYQNGQLKSEVEYLERGETMLNAWDSLGNVLVKNGNGLWVENHPNGGIRETGKYIDGKKQGTWLGYYASGQPYYKEQYELGNLIEGKSNGMDGVPYSYSHVFVLPEFIDGEESFKEFVVENIEYPEKAKGNDIEGTSIIEVYVTEEGKVINYELHSILGFGCEEEAIRLIKKYKGFKPARKRGEVFGARKLVAIDFSL